MSIASGIQAPVNGLPQRPTEVNEVLEYEKILSIYNQVTAGNHPRLRLLPPVKSPASAPLLDQHSSKAPTQPAPISSISESAQPAKPAPPTQLPSLRLNIQELPARAPPNLNGPSLSSRPIPFKPLPASELDPIFLTKSDDLVRAEIQLQRQRVERVLREQLEQKRIDARHKPSVAEAKPDFDVADVLTKALALVNPVAFDEPRGVNNNENGSASDSFDENSFYSSKAPDSTPRDGDDSQKSSVSKHQVQPVDNDELHADRLVDRRSDEMKQVDLTDSPYKVIPRPAFSTAPNPPYRLDTTDRGREGGAMRPAIALDEDEDEPEYSPPDATQPAYFKDGRNAISGEAYGDRGRRVNGRHGNQNHNNFRRHESPMDADVRIVRSHITSPLAPQPSRVSPLAVAKEPPISQNRRNRQEYVQQRRGGGVESERASPEMNISTSQPRKRRKLQDGRKGARRRVADSPEPVVKDEPVSPPPFHDVPPLGAPRIRPAAGNPIYIDDVESPRDIRYVPEPRPEPATRQVIYDVEHQAPHSAPRVLSRAGLREVPTVTRDLRRVVSVQNLPTRDDAEPGYPTPTRLSRAPSYVIGEGARRVQETRPFEGQPQMYERPQYVERPLPSPAYREVEPEHQYVVQSMGPPPQRRIIVDEYGQQFYETVQPARASAALPTARRLDVDSYNEVATLRNSSVRAASVFEEPYRETRYVQEMPPPQMIYRRVAEGPRSVTSDARYVTEEPRPAPTGVRYVTREPIEARSGQRSGSVQVYGNPIRQPTYFDENAPPREAIMRVSSVRPAGRAYDEPREFIQRVQSVRPEGRELSVFPEDRPQVRREPVQVEQPRYEVRRTAEGDRYYRIDDRGRMTVDGGVDATPVYAARY